MTYKAQIAQPDGSLPPGNWKDVEAGSMQGAAVIYLQSIGPKAEDYPIRVFVTDNKLRHANGAPMQVHGYLFELAEEEKKKLQPGLDTRAKV